MKVPPFQGHVTSSTVDSSVSFPEELIDRHDRLGTLECMGVSGPSLSVVECDIST